MKTYLYKIVLFSAVTFLTMPFVSCEETESDLVSFVEDNKLDTPNDTLYSLMGIINKMQAVADRTVILGEIRGELTSLTENANLDLQEIANFTADASNPYNDARDYYAIVQNCNYFIANADTLLTKRGRKVFEKEMAAVKAFRAWTYLQLAMNYGAVPFFTEPILYEKNADPSLYPHYDVKQIADYFVADLAPYVDMDFPDYGAINSLDSKKFYIPVRVLMGDLCLWAERYSEAAKYYHDFLTKQGSVHPIGVGAVQWTSFDFEEVRDNYAALFTSVGREELLTLIPMETSEYDGIMSYLSDVFNSTQDNNYYYQATHSKAYDELSQAQQYVLVYTDPVTLLPDTICASDTIHYESDQQKGDLRQLSVFTLRNAPSASDNFASVRQTCYKQSSDHVVLYRVQHVYLRFAEALNRAGYPQAAFAVLKYGLWKDNIEKYISEDERNKAGDLLSFSEYSFLRDNTMGIHSRGSGNADADTTYVIPTLPTKNDSILFVEEKICDEMALETAAEGLRFYDLMRIASHRNDPAFLASRVASRDGADKFNSELYSKLSNNKNWYLPLQ